MAPNNACTSGIRYSWVLPSMLLGPLLLMLPAEASPLAPGGLTFAAEQNLVSVPVSAHTAAWSLHREDLNVAFLEVPAAGAVSPAWLDVPHVLEAPSSLVRKLRVAENRKGVLRLAVRGSEPIDLLPRYRRVGGQWYLQVRVVPLKAPSRAPQAVATIAQPVHTTLTTTHYQARTDSLWVGFQGDPPAYRLIRHADPRRFQVDFRGVSLPTSRRGEVSVARSWLSNWDLKATDAGARLVLMPTPPQPLYIYSARVGSYVVFWRVAATPSAQPTPAPVRIPAPGPSIAPTPVLTPTPAPVSPTPEPTLAPTPAPAEPTPSPVPLSQEPTPMPAVPAPVPLTPTPAAGFELGAPAVGTTLGWVNETFGPESQSFANTGTMGLMLDWAPTWQDWRFPFAFGQTGYQFSNGDYPGTVHRRAVTLGALGVERLYRMYGLALASGLGYAGSWAQVTSNAGVPVAPAPSQMWFSPVMNLQGLELRQQVAYEASPGLALGLALAWTPIESADVSLTTAMPGLTRFRIAPSVVFGSESPVTLSLFYDQVLGGNFQQDATGISQSFSQTTTGASLTFGLGGLAWPGGPR